MKGINRLHKLLIFFVLGFSSCTDENIISEAAIAIENEWNRDNELVYEIDITDTISTYTVSAILQNTHDYQFCNLYLKYAVENDSNKMIASNFVELSLYSPTSGKPLGKEFILSDMQEGSYVLNYKLKFNELGKHKILLKHQMRDNQNLTGLKSVGVQVKKNELLRD